MGRGEQPLGVPKAPYQNSRAVWQQTPALSLPSPLLAAPPARPPKQPNTISHSVQRPQRQAWQLPLSSAPLTLPGTCPEPPKTAPSNHNPHVNPPLSPQVSPLDSPIPAPLQQNTLPLPSPSPHLLSSKPDTEHSVPPQLLPHRMTVHPTLPAALCLPAAHLEIPALVVGVGGAKDGHLPVV